MCYNNKTFFYIIAIVKMKISLVVKNNVITLIILMVLKTLFSYMQIIITFLFFQFCYDTSLKHFFVKFTFHLLSVSYLPHKHIPT